MTMTFSEWLGARAAQDLRDACGRDLTQLRDTLEQEVASLEAEGRAREEAARLDLARANGLVDEARKAFDAAVARAREARQAVDDVCSARALAIQQARRDSQTAQNQRSQRLPVDLQAAWIAYSREPQRSGLVVAVMDAIGVER